MTSLISENFIPVRIHVKEQPEQFDRWGAKWTPTILFLDAEAKERHRVEGFLPVEEFLAHLELGLGHIAFANKKYEESERHFRTVMEQFADTDAAPEALYWEGVSRYKLTGKPTPLGETAKVLQETHPESIWAKKASVWSS